MKTKQKVKIAIDALMTALLVVLMGIHLGLHWSVMAAMLDRRAKLFFRCAGTAAGLYGAYAVWKHQIWLYLSLRSEFLLFDFNEPGAVYVLDYLCMLALCVLLAHTAVSLTQNHRKGAGKL